MILYQIIRYLFVKLFLVVDKISLSNTLFWLLYC